MIDLCLRIGGIEKSPFGSAQDSTHFKYFRLRYKKTLQRCIQRCYKTVMVLFKLFPEARNPV